MVNQETNPTPSTFSKKKKKNEEEEEEEKKLNLKLVL